MTRGRLFATIVAVAIVAVLWTAAAPGARADAAGRPAARPRRHSRAHDSLDGAGSPDDVAGAAHRAGLDFVSSPITATDSAPDPPRYVDGVLVIDAVEISTAGGHYVALGIGQAPYRLAGDARDVIDDVHRLGGFGFAAHPDSPKPDLRWREWDVPLDGLEWLNADSEWRDETRSALARTF